MKWFIEGDIRGCFDNINHQMFIKALETKIKDSKFINIIRMFLKAGYVEDFTYHGTLSGTPQGGIISPILANIYLHGLDKKVLELKEEFDRPSTRDNTIEYARLNYRKVRLKRKITETAEPERSILLAEYFQYLMEYSCLKTLASKHDSSMKKVRRKYCASLPAISLLSSMFTKKMIAAFLTSVFTVAIVTGCVFNLTM